MCTSPTAVAFGTITKLIQTPLDDGLADDLSGEGEDSDRPPDRNLADISEYQGRLLAVSKVVTEGTAKEYFIQMKKFVQFLQAQKLMTNEDTLFSSRPHKDTP
ncbi:hypothetical protein FB451DRAFT_1384847 [Mycena latifolia]|nr:hypothetical protein FB451DRAFT_1384847 [Mycena latifolia]